MEALRTDQLDTLHEQAGQHRHHRRAWKKHGMKTRHRAEQADARSNQKDALQDPELACCSQLIFSLSVMISSCSFLDAGGWFVHVLRLRGRGGLKQVVQ